MVVRQGDLVWVDLPPPRGSEPSGRRPALVVQGDLFNRTNLNTVVVVSVTSNLKLAEFPGNVRLNKGDGGIPKSSVVNISQIHSIDRSFLRERIGSISREKLEQVKTGLSLILGMH